MKSNPDKNKVILGLSGGVDSTAAALILKEKGYEVTGLYFNVLSDFCMNSRANIEEGRKRAERAAEQLGIELICRDMSADFDRLVVNDFCTEYAKGRTPNPCIICNPLIKFRALLDTADEQGAYYIATGHYAGTHYDMETDRWHITKGKNEGKDQSYMLYRLDQKTISRLIMPLAEYEEKDEIRKLARNAGVANSEEKDSQEICFIDSDDSYIDFMVRKGHVNKPGRFVDKSGNILGKHNGIAGFTIGQRKGLGIALGKPAFVTEIDSHSNNVVLGDNDELFKKEINFINPVYSCGADKLSLKKFCEQYEGRTAFAKIRYAAKPAGAKIITLNENGGRLIFDVPQRAATPGQSVVLYKGNIVIGGGIID